MTAVSSLPAKRGLLVSAVAANAASLFFAHQAAAGDTPISHPSKQGDSSMDTVQDNAIRPFQFTAPEEAPVDLRRRIAATRWPERETVDDQSQGVQLATMRELARYWQTDYDWRKVEARLNALPQFMTNIDGLDIHFIHVRSKTRECVAADRHARVARLGHRAAEDHRSADRSHGAVERAHRTHSTS